MGKLVTGAHERESYHHPTFLNVKRKTQEKIVIDRINKLNNIKMRSERIESNKLKHEVASKISLTQLPQVPFCL